MANPGPTTALLLDIPAFRDADHDAGYYAAVYGLSDEWGGCTLYRSLDGGIYYSPVIQIKKAAVGGAAVAALASGTPGEWDLINTVQVTVRGQLESTTEVNAPLLLLGNEILRYQDATLIGSRGIMTTYELGKLKRGLKGTEGAVGSHAAGDRVVLLNENVIRVDGNVEDLGISQLIKAVSFGSTLASAAAVPFVNTGKGYIPPFPAGGNSGQVLTKLSNDDYDFGWQTP